MNKPTEEVYVVFGHNSVLKAYGWEFLEHPKVLRKFSIIMSICLMIQR
jgi:hypothetical protein